MSCSYLRSTQGWVRLAGEDYVPEEIPQREENRAEMSLRTDPHRIEVGRHRANERKVTNHETLVRH